MSRELPALDALAAAVADQAGADVAERLRTAIETSRRLSERGDALVERFVGEARAAGLSWAEIGEQFGTSKQAAQKRYGATVRGDWPGLADPARAAMDRAVAEARELGHDYVGTEHVLLGLVEPAAGAAADVLRDLGVTRERLLAHARPVANRRSSECVGMRPRLKRALELAGRIAAKLGRRRAGTEHLLAALVQVPDAMAIHVLACLGVDAGEVRVALAAHLDVDADLLVVRRRRRRLLTKAG